MGHLAADRDDWGAIVRKRVKQLLDWEEQREKLVALWNVQSKRNVLMLLFNLRRPKRVNPDRCKTVGHL